MPVKIMCVFGTRPEAIKMIPLVIKGKPDARFEMQVCVTAQHRQMLDQVMAAFDVKADYDLDLMKQGQTLTDITTGTLDGLGRVLDEAQPDVVLVHGDTTTSFAAALAAFYHKIPVGHVEAGLRTYDMYSPYPEEMNRCLTGRLATLHFAPTETSAENLRRENIKKNVFVTGNTVIDTLLSVVKPDYTFENDVLRAVEFGNKRTILLTAHRRENLGEPMRNIFTAIRELVERHEDLQVIYPVHMNPAVSEPAHEILGGIDRIKLIEPISVNDMHNLFSRCYLIMTDSGGIQEEAPVLGKPVLVLRTETERPEAVAVGTARVVGVEKEDIVREAETLLNDPLEYRKFASAKNPYGDGNASGRILDAIAQFFK